MKLKEVRPIWVKTFESEENEPKSGDRAVKGKMGVEEGKKWKKKKKRKMVQGKETRNMNNGKDGNDEKRKKGNGGRE